MGGLSFTMVWDFGTYGLYGKFTVDLVLIFILPSFSFSFPNLISFFLFIRYLCVDVTKYLTEAILIKIYFDL